MDFNAIRPLFGGTLKQHQVDGINRIVEYGGARRVSKLHLAYVLATVFHETGAWMQPIREGALRYGPSYTDAQAKRAVAAIHAKGIIRTNYALPSGPFGQSYYGRGLLQITWYDNYLKFENKLGIPLTRNPDLALDWNYTLPICFDGMIDGMFTSKSLASVVSTKDYTAARAIINGDVSKNGAKVAAQAVTFYNALGAYAPRAATPVTTQEETPDEPHQHSRCCLAPAWWPF